MIRKSALHVVACALRHATTRLASIVDDLCFRADAAEEPCDEVLVAHVRWRFVRRIVHDAAIFHAVLRDLIDAAGVIEIDGNDFAIDFLGLEKCRLLFGARDIIEGVAAGHGRCRIRCAKRHANGVLAHARLDLLQITVREQVSSLDRRC